MNALIAICGYVVLIVLAVMFKSFFEQANNTKSNCAAKVILVIAFCVAAVCITGFGCA